MIILVQQGQQMHVYILKCDGRIEAIYTNKDQAEADLRILKEDLKGYHVYEIVERMTEPHDNYR